MHRLNVPQGLLCLLLSVGVTAATAGEKGSIESLRGIRGFQIVVERLDSDGEAIGLKVADIRTDIELKLRLAGIKVLTLSEGVKEPGSPWLYVNTNLIVSKGPDFAVFSISIEVNQGVTLSRNSEDFVAATWNTSRMGFVTADKSRQIRDSLKDLVDKFINDYLTANPKNK